MAVLVEAISVVIRRSAIERSFPGGWDAFVKSVPNPTLCADAHLARVGFMTPVDVEAYVDELAVVGITYLADGTARDLVVVDQQRGPAAGCDWIEFGRVEIGEARDQRVAACRMVGDSATRLATPEAWTYEGSLSQTFTFVPTGELDKSMRFLRHEGGVDVYLNEVTGEEVYVGRTGRR